MIEKRHDTLMNMRIPLLMLLIAVVCLKVNLTGCSSDDHEPFWAVIIWLIAMVVAMHFYKSWGISTIINQLILTVIPVVWLKGSLTGCSSDDHEPFWAAIIWLIAFTVAGYFWTYHHRYH